MSIITNNKPRKILYGYELPSKVLSDFDYHDKETLENTMFFKYKNNYYDVSQFMRINNNPVLSGWEGYFSDSYFSGLLIKFDKYSDDIIVGMYFS